MNLAAFITCASLCVSAAGQTVADYARFTEKWEGRVLTSYSDTTGNTIIGVGHKLPLGTKKTISNDEASEILREDIVAAIAGARACVSSFDQQPQEVKKILVDLCFSMGRGGLSKFTKTIAALNSFDYTTASNELKNSRWYKQTTRRGRNHVTTLANLSKSRKR